MWQLNKYIWLSLACAVVYVFVAGWFGLLECPAWVAVAVGVLAALNGLARTWYAYRHGGHSGRAGNLFTVGDTLFISLAVWATRGINSDLWLLYFVVVISESLYAPFLQTATVFAGIACAYVLATLPHVLAPTSPMRPLEYAGILATRLFFIMLVGGFGRRISENAATRSRELLLLREQMATAEERARIAREVHDGLGHALVSVILRLELCARLMRKSPEEAEAILKDEIPALRAAWNEGRDLAFHLHPWEGSSAENESLPETLRRCVARFVERTGLKVDLNVAGDGQRVRPAVAFALTRIVQEALTNAAKHSRASAIEVSLSCALTGEIVCSIQDNGQGFAPNEPGGGLGLQAMRERTEALGGVFKIESASGHGAQVVVTVPA